AASGYFEAARMYERALALWDVVPTAERPVEEDHVELLYETSGALQTAEEPERALEVARAAVDGVDAERQPLRAARFEERLAWSIYLTADLAEGTRRLRAVTDRLDGLPPSTEAAGCLASLATFTLYGGRYREAIPIAERAIDMSAATGAVRRQIEAMGALGAAAALEGDCDRGLSVLREALDMARGLGDPGAISMAYLGLASTLHDCDALQEAVEIGLEGSAWALGSRIPGFSTMAVESMVPLGRWREAEAILAAVQPGWDEGSGAHWNAVFGGVMAVRAGRSIDGSVLVGLRRVASGLLTDAAFSGNLAVGLIELALLEGRLDDARATVDDGLGWLADADDVRFRSRLLRLGLTVEAEIATTARARRDEAADATARSIGLERLERLRALLSSFDDGVSPVFAEARGNLALAEAEATRLLDRPDPIVWSAAADRLTTPRRPYELAWARYRQAEAMLARRERRTDVAAVLGEARSLADEIGAEPLSAMIRGLATIARLDLPSQVEDAAAELASTSGTPEPEVVDPYGLTAREREVLVLLAQGQTNRRIAETLFISESTASVHVSNIIGKLGVSNRVEAAAAAVRSGLAR
ncbi:MAG TPA: response regulator transcription factor, partial [Solirubrobacterales bacterium]|nr:response regulator transcription factor [Solirubrobacterales bacterium]